MNVFLVGPDIEENLSIRYLATALEQAGHRCRIADFRSSRDIPGIVRQIVRKDTGLVGLSLVFQRRCYEYFKLVKKLGGHFANLRSNEIMRDVPGLDTILHHEGEARITGLAELLAKGDQPPGSLDGITWRDHGGRVEHRPAQRITPLDSLSHPTRRRPDRFLGIPSAPLVSSRGCTGNCSFCSIRAWQGQVSGARFRMRSPELIAEEMAELHRTSGVRIFNFHDDDFIHPDRHRALERCRQILDTAEERIGEPFAFMIKCRPRHVEEDLFTYLRSKGLVRTYVGIESHAVSGLRVLNRENNREDNERALAILDRLGIYSYFNLLLFDPETTVVDLRENLAFLARCDHMPVEIARAELYAGTALEERMIAEGRISGDYRDRDYTISDPAAEAVFRLFLEALGDRHFWDRPIIRAAQDLGYRLSLTHRFHPETVSGDLRHRIVSLIRRVNRDTIGNLEDCCRFVEERDGAPGQEEVREFADAMRKEALSAVEEQLRTITRLSFELRISRQLARLGYSGRVTPVDWPGLLRRVALTIPYTALALGMVSCNNRCNHGDPVGDPVGVPPTWNAIEAELDDVCATSGCHDAETASEGLDLTSGQSYANIVDVPSTQVPLLDRVEPAEPDSSYLLHKLEGTQSSVGGTGERMPKDGTPDWRLTSAIYDWIFYGAEPPPPSEDP